MPMITRIPKSRPAAPARAAAWCVLCLAVLAGAGCFSSGASTKNADVVVRGQADLAKLAETQKGLELTPGKASTDPRIQVISGAAVENFPEYRIGPGDVLELIYLVQYDRSPDPYRLQVQDRINVVFAFHPQFNTSTMVRNDGKVSLQLVGEVLVEGMTPEEVTALLTRKYAKYILAPSLNVSLEEGNVKIDELKKAITTAGRGQSRAVPVAPDGRIGVPLIGNVQAQGLTVSQLEKMLNEQYGQRVKDIHVDLLLSEIHHAKCYVLGEVERPGVYEMPGREPLLAVLARAGSFKTTAGLGDVLIFRNDGLERPVTIKVDLSQTTQQGLLATNILVHPADIIFVPKGTIDNVNDMINKIFTKGLYSVLPFSSSFSANYDFSKQYNYR